LLSEGEKKRLALALVLMQQPSHGLLLDEPSLGQDQGHKDTLVRLLRSVADSGRVVILTTHDLALASRADRMVLLGSQGVVIEGPTHQVLGETAAWDAIGIHLPDWFHPDCIRGRQS
jgi:energy-coupling factor transport system ATP-binding protein